MTTEFDRIFIDTNVLVYATFDDFDAGRHTSALEKLDALHHEGKRLCVSPQILREFYAVSAKGAIFKKPLARKKAVQKLKEFMNVFSLVYETPATIHRLISLLEKYAVGGARIHDMNIVATMLDNDVTNLFTFNEADFVNVKEISLIK